MLPLTPKMMMLSGNTGLATNGVEDLMHTILHRIAAAMLFTVVTTAVSCAQGAAGIAFEFDTTMTFTTEAGQPLALAMRACDERQSTVEDWDNIGKDVTLTVRGSRAETDTSARSWNRRSRAFTWVFIKAGDTVLPLDSIRFVGDEPLLFYTIPKTVFVSGLATLSYTQSRADTGIVLSLAPRWTFLNQDSPPLAFLPGPPENFLIEITSQTAKANEVFLLRRYEIVVTPRDRYLNPQPDSTVSVLFGARFPKEFDLNQPGLVDVFDGAFPVRGPTPIMLASRISRPGRKPEDPQDRQWIRLRSEQDSTIEGRSDEYAILDHAPNPFSLLSPPDEKLFRLDRSTTEEVFTWEDIQPRDPYYQIRISRFDTVPRYSDEVRYMIRIVDAISYTRAVEFSSDNNGMYAQWTTRHSTLYSLINQISGLPNQRTLDMVWYVEATDGLYVTISRPPSEARPGFRMTIDKYNYHEVPDAAEPLPDTPALSLHPNYPNPFNPATVIPVMLQAPGHCRLRVLDLMGKVVALLHDGFLEAGPHRFSFDGSGLPSGVYSYRLESNGETRTRRMLLLR